MDSTNTLVAELGIRTQTPLIVPETYRQVVTRLSQCVAQDKLDGVNRFVWDGDPQTPTNSSRTPKDRYERYANWARSNDYSLQPAFNERVTGSPVDDQAGTAQTFPLISLAIFAKDDIAAVFPFRDSQRIWTLIDGIDAIDDRSLGEAFSQSEEVKHERRPISLPSS